MAAVMVASGATSARAYATKETGTGATIRWEVDHLDVFVGSGLARGVPAADQRRATRRAAAAWRRPGAPRLVVATQPAGDYAPGTPGVHVVVPDAWAHAPSLLAVTMTLYEDTSGQLLDADVLINPAARLAVLAREGGARWDLQSLLTHELGHVLGLGESSDDAEATMWPRLRAGETHARTLTADDRRGLDAIYGAAALGTAGGCSFVGARADGPWPLAMLALLGGLAWALRRRGAAPAPLGAAVLFLFWLPTAATSPAPLDAARWQPFAGASVVGLATVEPAEVGEDGFHRTRVHVGDQSVDVLGGCVDGTCMRFGDEEPPRDGDTVLVAPATGAWARVEGPSAFGGWLGHGPALPLSRDAI